MNLKMTFGVKSENFFVSFSIRYQRCSSLPSSAIWFSTTARLSGPDINPCIPNATKHKDQKL